MALTRTDFAPHRLFLLQAIKAGFACLAWLLMILPTTADSEQPTRFRLTSCHPVSPFSKGPFFAYTRKVRSK